VQYATIWRVLRHWASQIQRLFLRRATKEHISASSSTSECLAFASVVFKGGKFTAFLSQVINVWRLMPKMRQTPRNEARS